MAKNSVRIAAALATLAPELKALDHMPGLKSVGIVVIFDSKTGDFTQVTPRFDLATDKSHLTPIAAPSP